MGFYDRHVVPRLIDRACAVKPVLEQRRKLVPQAGGRVLEIGIGSGLNLDHYDRGSVVTLFGLEPSPELMRMATRRAERLGMTFEALRGGAEEIPLEDGEVDTVVVTYTMCSIERLPEALAEMRRVLRPGGRLIFSEHGRAPDPGIARWQDRLTPLWRRIAGGCRLNRDVPALLRESGFELASLHQHYLPGTPKVVGFNSRGMALRR